MERQNNELPEDKRVTYDKENVENLDESEWGGYSSPDDAYDVRPGPNEDTEWFPPKKPDPEHFRTKNSGKRIDLPSWTDERLVIPEWKFPDARDYLDSVFLLMGKRGSGKTHLGKHLVRWLAPYIARAIIFTNTAKANRAWNAFFPKPFIRNHISDYVFDAIKQGQEILLEDRLLNALARKDPWHDPRRTLLILDDKASDWRMNRNTELNSIAMEGRHFLLPEIITSQYPKAIGTKTRGNPNLVFIFQSNSPDENKMLWNMFGFGLSYHQWEQLMVDYVNDMGKCVVVNHSIASRHYKDQFAWFAAPKEEVEPFKFGWQPYWDEAERMEHEEDSGVNGEMGAATQRIIREML
jgi:hypothetical protein